jgi:hypothetical protein
MIRGQLPAHISFTKVITGVPQLSVAVTAVISGDGTSVIQATVILTGQLICGAMLSFTVIVWLQVAELPQLSVAW